MDDDQKFDGEEGKRRRDRGVARASAKHQEWLAEARAKAREIAIKFGEVDADDIQAACPPPFDAHCNIMGAVFKTKEFTPIGYRNSERVTAHSRVIRVYKLSVPA